MEITIKCNKYSELLSQGKRLTCYLNLYIQHVFVIQYKLIILLCSYRIDQWAIVIIIFCFCETLYQIWGLHWCIERYIQPQLPADISLHLSKCCWWTWQWADSRIDHHTVKRIHRQSKSPRLWLKMNQWGILLLFPFIMSFIVRTPSQTSFSIDTAEVKSTRMLGTSWLQSILSIKWTFTRRRSVETPPTFIRNFTPLFWLCWLL